MNDQPVDEKPFVYTTSEHKWDEKYCLEIIEHMSRGYSLESFAAKISVSRYTLYEWKEKHPEFKSAVEQGTDASLLFYETLGIQMMAGKLKNSNASTYALTMANKHKWRTGREDITSNDEKIEPMHIYVPEKMKEE